MIPRLCEDCGHPVGRHNHMVPHDCKEDRCGCPAYVRKLANVERQK